MCLIRKELTHGVEVEGDGEREWLRKIAGEIRGAHQARSSEKSVA